MSTITTNPRITNYCLANGLTLAQTSGELWKYLLWSREMWSQWRAECGIKDRWHHANEAEMADYDAWLSRQSISLANSISAKGNQLDQTVINVEYTTDDVIASVVENLEFPFKVRPQEVGAKFRFALKVERIIAEREPLGQLDRESKT